MCDAKTPPVTIKAALHSRAEFDAWLKEYEERTSTKWIVQRTRPESQRLVCRIDYACHHSAYGKRETSKKSKNKQCKASISVTILKNVLHGVPATITVNSDHSHSTDNAEVRAALPASKNTRRVFEEYFSNGMGVMEAINFHLTKLEMTSEEKQLANGSTNPKARTVYHWYDEWRRLNLEQRAFEGVIQKLKEKHSEYVKMGTTVIIQEDPFVIVCMTNLMKRAHKFATDIVFVDSTASCDAEHHSLTFMLTCTEAGVFPIAVIITKGQTMIEYEAAFNIVRDTVGMDGFGGNGFPKIFMTDDSDAERGALKRVFPESQLLLCSFHVGQSVRRWLYAKEHKVCKDDRQHMYKLFQDVLTASTITSADNNFLLLQTDQISCKYSNWIKHTDQYWSSRESWCLAFRGATTCDNQTNNFSETAVRIYKDIVLSRCKAYNAVSLVDFTCTVLEQYYMRLLRNYANGRVDQNRQFFPKIAKNSAYLTLEQIHTTDFCNFTVPSQKDSNTKYHVDLVMGSCSCDVGRLGKLCKHIVCVYWIVLKKHSMYNRYEIAKLALGDLVNPKEFYEPMKDSQSPLGVCSPAVTVDPQVENSLMFLPGTELQVPCEEISSTSTQCELQPASTWHDKLSNLLTSKLRTYPCTEKTMKQFIKRLENVRSSNSLESFLSTAGSEIQIRNRRASIRVQPAARRRPGVTRRSKRLATGRPAGCEPPRKKHAH